MTRHCTICNNEIHADRAEALPNTMLCSVHAREIEKYGGEFTCFLDQERVSKQGSIKQNYGSASQIQVRNHTGLAKLREQYKKDQE